MEGKKHPLREERGTQFRCCGKRRELRDRSKPPEGKRRKGKRHVKRKGKCAKPSQTIESSQKQRGGVRQTMDLAKKEATFVAGGKKESPTKSPPAGRRVGRKTGRQLGEQRTRG